MIVQTPSNPGCGDLRLVLRPPRLLSGRQLGGLFAVLSGSMWLVALLSASQGNVFAPVFALVDTAIVAAAFRWMWQLGERQEQIEVDADVIRVRRCNNRRAADVAPVFEAHPYWVRLSLGDSSDDPHVVLDAQGQQVEVGGFLAPGERAVLAGRLYDALQVASGRTQPSLVKDAMNQEQSE